MTAQLSLADALATVPLLSRLSSTQRARLAKLATTRKYQAGSVIVRQGDTSMSFYVLLSGRVRVEQELVDNQRLALREFGAGGYFGEMGLIDDMPRSATVVAVEPTECALLAKWDFGNELRDDPDIAIALLPILCQRIRDLEGRRAADQPAWPAGLVSS
ncbi:MAG TPA: cyclic nucleotide-binding domain-containing protein [Chloroflexota bacterium]|jgi:CRP-like cAMP-binding protein